MERDDRDSNGLRGTWQQRSLSSDNMTFARMGLGCPLCSLGPSPSCLSSMSHSSMQEHVLQGTVLSPQNQILRYSCRSLLPEALEYSY